MRSFDELSSTYKFVPIRSHDEKLSGYIHLDGLNTKVSLNSKNFHHFEKDDDGWFDIEIEDAKGSRILLHNALRQSNSMPSWSKNGMSGSYTTDIFPNIVIIGAENIRSDKLIQSLDFEIEGAENFFVYQTIEWQSVRTQSDGKSLLKSIREKAWKPPRNLRVRHHCEDPQEIYVLHRSKKYIDFTIEDMKIKVWHARSQRGMGWPRLNISITPVISIVFNKPISIDEALDRVWRIKGFFDQLALNDLRIRSLTFSKFKKGWPSADVYLPNESAKMRIDGLDLHPSHVPLFPMARPKAFRRGNKGLVG